MPQNVAEKASMVVIWCVHKHTITIMRNERRKEGHIPAAARGRNDAKNKSVQAAI